ncbi:hydantoinase/oxoprolinase family protein [Conexivisphaera calida]|uniref:N-methylhydantoinase A n=1 Tax=Conexivisphaera calida TaxID=1874277 RepID=A0A4P2VDH3_9ARCH|nr:hydantoinase/oxoprolinase family protein [Conexivisphaera calida]BBE41443.1 N-methylhydantoinase A [Conexivisphaera calida]
MPRYYVGVDIGGTFTDIVVFDSISEDVRVLKVPSTPANPEEAVVGALRDLNIDLSDVALLNHATTVATNALLTRSGLPRTALVTNKGFRDVLEIGRQRRPEIYNIWFTKPIPLVPRKYRLGIGGRVLADGSVKEEIPEEDLQRIRKFLLRNRVESVAISLLNSYANPAHEMKVKEGLSGCCRYIFTSYEVNPEYREYERTSTTVVNAVLAPIVSSYLDRFVEKIRGLGIEAPVYVMTSNGGLNTVQHASMLPISIIESGPAAGVLASAFLAHSMGLGNAMTFDMGGTTAKAGSIVEGKPDVAYEFEAAGKTHSGRSIKGSGYAVRFPFIDLAEVSAGGGTVAWVDEAGSLRVGPRSAGADPGPAAYGRGGTEPTVTDANVVLGRLNQRYLLGGRMAIYADLAERALESVGRAIGLDAVETAKGIIRLIDNAMAKAISIVSVERGRDPRSFPMIAFGGAGPLHACDLAEEMGMRNIVVPEHPGLFSAYGLLTVDVTRLYTAPVFERDLSRVVEELGRNAREDLGRDGFRDVHVDYLVDMRYRGQSYEITVEYGDGSSLREKFESEHRRMYGYTSEDPVEIVGAKAVARAEVPKIALRMRRPHGGSPSPSSSRTAYISGRFIDTPVYVREELSPGMRGSGPAIIEEYDSTTVVNDGWSWEIDGLFNIVMRR